jgi:hypothetical protein
MNDSDLYMNVPMGYPFAAKLTKADIGGIKSFLINTTPDEQAQQLVREMTNEQVIQTCLDNNFTFDPEWLGARLFDWQKT